MSNTSDSTVAITSFQPASSRNSPYKPIKKTRKNPFDWNWACKQHKRLFVTKQDPLYPKVKATYDEKNPCSGPPRSSSASLTFDRKTSLWQRCLKECGHDYVCKNSPEYQTVLNMYITKIEKEFPGMFNAFVNPDP